MTADDLRNRDEWAVLGAVCWGKRTPDGIVGHVEVMSLGTHHMTPDEVKATLSRLSTKGYVSVSKEWRATPNTGKRGSRR